MSQIPYDIGDELADARRVEPLSGGYREEPGPGEDRGYVEVSCPSCDYSIPAWKLVLEGGGKCDGCERNVRLHVTSHDMYGEWRNVPKDRQEAYR